MLGIVTSIKGGGVKPDLWGYISHLNRMIGSCKGFPRVREISTIASNWADSVIIKNAIILDIMQYISISMTQKLSCIILVLLKSAGALSYYLNVR